MKIIKRPSVILLLATILVLSLSITPALASSKYVPTDPYVVAYNKSDKTQYDNQLPYMYQSPHRGSMGIRDLESGRMEYWSVGYELYNLIDTTALPDLDNAFYASIPAYCTDACISTSVGVEYKRTNLENCSYYEEGVAGRIRAVCQNSFPYIKDISTIEETANRWLAENHPNNAPISNLTGAEVIAATQYTIWCIANEKDVESRSPYSSTPSVNDEDLSEVIIHKDGYVDCTEGKRDTTSNNIKMLHLFYMSLSPVSPDEVLIADDSIEIIELDHQKQKNGTFTATVTFKVNATINEDDKVTVSAICGDIFISKPLTTGVEQNIVLEGLEGHDDVVIALDGGQKANGIFLFESEGGRNASQTMVCYNDSFLPCHAEVIATCDGNEPQIPLEEDPSQITSNPKIPNTGDTLMFFIYTFIVLLISFCLSFIIVKYKRD